VGDHTPGPWTLGKRETGGQWIDAEGETRPIALAFRNFPTETDDANARLIAAAPNLLAALEAIVRQAEPLYAAIPDSPATHSAHVLMDEARAAIAKAKGEA
jgi:hypothetical protein